jgi:hypothetical protein
VLSHCYSALKRDAFGIQTGEYRDELPRTDPQRAEVGGSVINPPFASVPMGEGRYCACVTVADIILEAEVTL